jgi:hypothetical protein
MTDDNHTKLIPLTQGKFAIVDADDYDYLMQWKWQYNLGYGQRRTLQSEGKNTSVMMHRIINKTPNDMYTDHINGNRLDNRKSNLRNCTSTQNCYNRKIYINNYTSKYKGVRWVKKDNIWIASIGYKKEKYHIGSFKNEEDAAEAYNKKAIELFGEFASLNIVLRKRMMYKNDKLRSSTKDIIGALKILEKDIYSDDGVTNAVIGEAWERLTELNELLPYALRYLERVGNYKKANEVRSMIDET